MTVCYSAGDTLPINGWLVACRAIGRFTIATTLDELVVAVGAMRDEDYAIDPKRDAPISVYELGREMHVSLDYALKGIRPK